MSDWTIQPRNTIEEALHMAGYRVTYNYACMYTTNAPAGSKTPSTGWLYYGNSRDDAWTAAYKHYQRRGDIPPEILNILLGMLQLYEGDDYPSAKFAQYIIELRDFLKQEKYIS